MWRCGIDRSSPKQKQVLKPDAHTRSKISTMLLKTAVTYEEVAQRQILKRKALHKSEKCNAFLFEEAR